ncbi:ribokinase [Kushneria sinocarnis]|uniref:Ribokinase n=1 Tax=Kushneria sinocarnis TaxID=595502 RepID=A0A420WWH4_9GAMM|nr:PfkB family carbohydrate kinase [Kushneria sinocarnis]RKR03454.1 ribokinase [Kushneria sinocarnis]
MNARTLLALGSVNADFQVRIDDTPGSAETLLAHDQRRLSGGKASNAAYIGCTFGCRSVLLACVGDDDLATHALSPLHRAGVDISRVARAEGESTGVSMIMVPPTGKKQIVLATNANDHWPEESIQALQDEIGRTPLPALLSVNYEVPADVVHQAIVMAHHHNIPIVLDPSFPERVEQALLDRITAITPNVAEAKALTGIEVDGPETAARAARRLLDAGVGMACVKLADGGCVLGTGTTLSLIPSCDAEVVDTTGAGDAFTGVLAVALLEGCEPLTAASRAVAAASLAVTAYGSQPSYPARECIEKRVPTLLQHARALDER